jgi:hypothetical protein
LAIPEHDHAAAFAGPTVLQADMDRIQAVLHETPVTASAWREARPPLCQGNLCNVNVTRWLATPKVSCPESDTRFMTL